MKLAGHIRRHRDEAVCELAGVLVSPTRQTKRRSPCKNLHSAGGLGGGYWFGGYINRCCDARQETMAVHEKMRALFLLASLVAFVASSRIPKRDKLPPFCNGYDCPLFDVLSTFADVELRRYRPSTWVTTVYYAKDESERKQKAREAFFKLFKYIQGENENHEKIKMTVPVITKVIPCNKYNCATQYVRSFYLPWAYQGGAPRPTNPDVFIEKKPAMDVYVRSFGGFADSNAHLANIRKMAKELGNDSLYEEGYYIRAGYDSPWKLRNRHNEGWLVVKRYAKY